MRDRGDHSTVGESVPATSVRPYSHLELSAKVLRSDQPWRPNQLDARKVLGTTGTRGWCIIPALRYLLFPIAVLPWDILEKANRTSQRQSPAVSNPLSETPPDDGGAFIHRSLLIHLCTPSPCLHLGARNHIVPHAGGVRQLYVSSRTLKTPSILQLTMRKSLERTAVET